MNECANCGGTTKRRCLGCVEGVDIDGKPTSTHYCNEECQIKHWSEHKLACKAARYRNQLYRAGDLVQQVFYDMRREAYTMAISNVQKDNNGIISLTRRARSEEERRLMLVDFPSHLYHNDNDNDDAKAVLARDACGDAISRMLFLVVAALKGSYHDIKVVLLEGPGRYLRVKYVGESLVPAHELFKIALKDGNEYAFDLAGAQYGRCGTVTPWAEYWRRLSVTSEDVKQLGAYALEVEQHGADLIDYHALRLKEPDAEQTIDAAETVQMIFELTARFVSVEAMEWLQDKDTSIPDILALSAAEYRQRSTEFTSMIKQAVRDLVMWLKKPESFLTLMKIPQTQWDDTDRWMEVDEEMAQMLLRVAPASRLEGSWWRDGMD